MIKVLNVKNDFKFFDEKVMKYYGLGRTQQVKINNLFGLGLSGFISNLDKSFILKMELYIREFYLIEDSLKSYILDNISLLESNKLYKGMRHKWKLPVNGQRTRSNAQTIRKLSSIKLQRYTLDVYKLK